MSIFADAAGVVKGRFTIPAGIPAGVKKVEFHGPTSVPASTNYTGSTVIEEIVRQLVTTITISGFDPLAQTFLLSEKCQLGAVDIFLTNAGKTGVSVQIRETELGFPTQTVIGSTSMKSSEITADMLNRFVFDRPITLQADREYALVILCDDPFGAAGVADLGGVDVNSLRYVTVQPYTIGTLLSSSNASTWTAHQNRDLTFALLRNSYTDNTKTISLGSVSVEGATDLKVAGIANIPDESCRVEYRLTMPDSSIITVLSEQIVQLDHAVTGDIQIAAILHGSERFSPTLFAGTRLLWGVMDATGDYVSRAMIAGPNSRVRVIFDAIVPGGASVSVFVSGVDAGDTWVPIPKTGNPTPIDNGLYEFSYELAGVNENMVKVKIVKSGTPAARPHVENIRMMVM